MDFPNYRLRLAETITWCLGQSLESMPGESDEIKQRRKMIERAVGLMQRAVRSSINDGVNKVSEAPEYVEANRLIKDADPSSIEPLKDQLRSVSLKPSSTLDYPQLVTGRIGIVEDVA